MSLDLKNKEWEEFVFEQIFEIDSTSSGIDRNKLISKNGEIPYLTRSDKNNGYDSFICEQSNKYKIDVSNVITVGLDTQTVFYQPNRFYTGQNIQILKCKKLNKEIAQFLIPLIKRQMEKFSWGGNGATLTRLRRSKLLLPTNENGTPDFDFMEAFMKQKEQEKFQEYDNYIRKRIKALNDFKPVEPIEEKEWGEFKLQSIFNSTKGDQNRMSDLKKGYFSLISAKNGNNGLKDFVTKNNKKVYPSNTLTLNNDGDGGAGISYYQPFEYLLDSHVTSLDPKIKLSKFSLLFISRCITKQRNKFGHGYSLTNNRLTAFKIMLPINDQNEPDYEYMENYMKQLEYNKLNEYLLKKTGEAELFEENKLSDLSPQRQINLFD